ncbi:MAG: hypothetical protein KAY22_01450 [Rhizorhabdus sp.]|uniref:hypothetical protein n=1 Tax=Rhizorhabdus sp. TaxID=1968843 RepID=UPI001B735487|nr:hypothetical protein [Rhizorhabdus sp.]MBP8230950.1 hypothetical protein [Rhizorhabdus sp.]
MSIGFEHQPIGRYIIDIDGCLRATDQRVVDVRELRALHGRMDEDALLVRELNGETIPLSADERIELNEHSVAFFRSCSGPRLFRYCIPQVTMRGGWYGGRAIAA